MLEQMKKSVFEANRLLKDSGLIVLTWGNVSQIDRESGYVVIKPSGVSYDALRAEDMVVVDLEGNVTTMWPEGGYAKSFMPLNCFAYDRLNYLDSYYGIYGY